jgi:hypothetical protein
MDSGLVLSEKQVTFSLFFREEGEEISLEMATDKRSVERQAVKATIAQWVNQSEGKDKEKLLFSGQELGTGLEWKPLIIRQIGVGDLLQLDLPAPFLQFHVLNCYIINMF